MTDFVRDSFPVDGMLVGSTTETGNRTWLSLAGSGFAVTGGSIAGGDPRSPMLFVVSGISLETPGPVTVTADITTSSDTGMAGVHIGAAGSPAGWTLAFQQNIFGAEQYPNLRLIRVNASAGYDTQEVIPSPLVLPGSVHNYSLTVAPDGQVTVLFDGAELYSAARTPLPAQPWVAGVTTWTGALRDASIDNFAVPSEIVGGAVDPDPVADSEVSGLPVAVVLTPSSGAVTVEGGTAPISDAAVTGVTVPVALTPVAGPVTVEGGIVPIADAAVAGEPVIVSLAPAPGTVVAIRATALQPHVADLVGTGAVLLFPEPGIVTADPPVAPIPAHAEVKFYETVAEHYDRSPVLPDGTLDSDWAPVSVHKALWGRHQLTIGGHDVTFLGGMPVDLGEIRETDPFGYEQMTARFPGLSKAKTRPEWLRPGALAKVQQIRPDGTRGMVLWEGQVKVVRSNRAPRRTGIPAGRTVTVVDLVGTLGLTDLQVDTPSRLPKRSQLGGRIKRELRDAKARRYTVSGVDTPGLYTISRGEWQSIVKGRVAGLLSESLRVTGDQLTVMTYPGRQVKVEWRDRTTIAAEVWLDQPGIDIDLEEDVEQSFNRLFVEYVDPEGGRHQGWRYPNFGAFRPLAYPFADENNMIRVGTTDADTGSGSGVSDWKKKMRDQHVKGLDYDRIRTFTEQDKTRLRRLQDAWDLDVVDGVLGPQTWTASFAATFDGASFEGAKIHPMKKDRRTEYWTYTPDGARLRRNKRYDPSVVPVDAYLNLGSGVTREVAEEAADAYWEQHRKPIFSGTIVARGVDFVDGNGNPVSRYSLRAGQNIRVHGFEGNGHIDVHVAERVIAGNEVRWSVDSASRDFVDLLTQRERDRAAFAGPVVRNNSNLGASISTPFDADSGAGEFRMTTLGGHWSVVPVPLAEWGTIFSTEIKADKRTRMSAYLFANRITVAELDNIIPKPLAKGARKAAQETLVARYKRLAGWGDDSKAGGFGYGCDTAGEEGDTTDPVGSILDDGPIRFRNLEHSPCAYLAVWTEASAEVTGHLKVEAL